MKQIISNSQRILLVCYVVTFIVHTLAAPPEEVENGFIPHRQWLREARNLASVGSKFPSGTAIGPEKQFDPPLPVINITFWAGAVQSLPPAGRFRSVTAQWTVPTASRPPTAKGSGEWSMASWVGIDSSTCGSTLVQAGITSSVQVSSSGAVTTEANAWYEWLPSGATTITTLTVAPGDTVQVTVRVHSPSRGTARVNNLSTGNSTMIGFSAPNNSSKICGRQAEWVVEDYLSGGFVPFANFTPVYFQHCKATTTTGEKFHLNNSTLIDMVRNNTVMATAVYKSPTELEVHYG